MGVVYIPCATTKETKALRSLDRGGRKGLTSQVRHPCLKGSLVEPFTSLEKSPCKLSN